MVQTSGDIIEIMGSCRVSNFVKNTIPTYYKHTLVGSLASGFLGWTWNTHVGIPMLEVGEAKNIKLIQEFIPIFQTFLLSSVSV